MTTRIFQGKAWGPAAAFLALWVVAAVESRRRPFTYDEAAHAHMAWLLDHGQTPYRDFAANHLPFFWMGLRPAVRLLPESTTAWYAVLRHLALAGQVAFLALLAAHAARGGGPGAWGRALGAVGLVALAPPALSFFVEFRPDSLANPLLLGGLWLLRGRPRRAAACGGGFLTAAALLVNTKYLLLPAILAALAAWRAGWRAVRVPAPGPASKDGNGFVSTAVWAAGGAALALAAAWGLLRAYGIDPSEAWQLAVRYNTATEKLRTFGFGLWRAVLRHPFLLGYMLLGVGGVVWQQVHRRFTLGLWPLGVAVFLAAQVLLMTKPWLQYKASWFLLAATFPALFVAREPPPRARRWEILCWSLVAILAVVSVTGGGGRREPLFRLPDGQAISTDLATQVRVADFLLRHAAPEEYVVAEFPWQPLFRSNTFYKIIMDYDGRGRDALEWAAQALPDLPHADRMTEPAYLAELQQRPPAVIFLGVFLEQGPVWSPYTEQRTRAIEAFLESRRDEYEFVEIPDSPFAVVRRVKTGPGSIP